LLALNNMDASVLLQNPPAQNNPDDPEDPRRRGDPALFTDEAPPICAR